MIALHLTAILCGQINREPLFGTSLSFFLSLVRTSVYIALFTAWGFSIRYRVVSVHTKFYLTLEAVLMVLWMLVRTIKYLFTVGADARRLLWYLYYVPMLLIPLFAIFASLSLGKYGHFRLPRWTVLFVVMTGLLLLLVLTNDLHQLVFSFPENAAVFSDQDYRHGPGYYLILIFEGVSILLALGIMLKRSHLPRSGSRIWQPAIPIAVMIAYTFLYVTNYSFLNRFAGDLTISFCCLTIAAYECCIGNHLIQINAHYSELFAHAAFPICIVDEQYALYMACEKGEDLARKVQQEKQHLADMPDDGLRVSSMDISGGKVFWAEDVSLIRREIETLRDLQESLKSSHLISTEEYRTRKEKARLEEVNRIYGSMQAETSGYLHRLQQLLDELAEETQEEKEKRLLGKIAVYGAYVKRRNNLLFVAETQNRMQGSELALCLRESVTALAYLGIRADFEVEEQREFSLQEMIRIYDLFQRVLEASLDDLKALMMIVRWEADGCMLYLNLSVTRDNLTFPACFEAEQEDDKEYLLTCRIAHNEEVSDHDSLL